MCVDVVRLLSGGGGGSRTVDVSRCPSTAACFTSEELPPKLPPQCLGCYESVADATGCALDAGGGGFGALMPSVKALDSRTVALSSQAVPTQ
jgi:hypothetical protein